MRPPLLAAPPVPGVREKYITVCAAWRPSDSGPCWAHSGGSDVQLLPSDDHVLTGNPAALRSAGSRDTQRSAAVDETETFTSQHPGRSSARHCAHTTRHAAAAALCGPQSMSLHVEHYLALRQGHGAVGPGGVRDQEVVHGVVVGAAARKYQPLGHLAIHLQGVSHSRTSPGDHDCR